MCDSRTARLQPFCESQKLLKSWLEKNQGTEILRVGFGLPGKKKNEICIIKFSEE